MDCCRYLIPATAAAHTVRIFSLFTQILLDSDHLHAARHHMSSEQHLIVQSSQETLQWLLRSHAHDPFCPVLAQAY